MSHQNIVPLVLGFGAAALGLFYAVKSSQQAHTAKLRSQCSEPQLLALLDDLMIEYTPFYLHYFHMLCALDKEYPGKPNLQQELKLKIYARINDRSQQVQQQVA